MAKRTSSSRTRSRRPAPQRPRRKTRKTTTRRASAKTKARKVRRKARKPASRPARQSAKPKQPRRVAARRPRGAKPARVTTHDTHPPTLQRERRRLPDAERTTAPAPDQRLVAEARTGHDAIVRQIREHTQTSPALTAGDIDAKWEDADSVGDEAPGGDNPTPGQNEVDAIGRALGTEYDDDEELLGGEEIEERDEHRWELDPDSKDEDE